jgi:hypothetical protein
MFFFFSAFPSCSPSPCRNNGVCITKPKAGSYCKWVSRLFSFTVLWWFFHIQLCISDMINYKRILFSNIAVHLDMLVNFVSTQIRA